MPRADNYIGGQIGNYRIVAELAVGGFGRVYRAEHIFLNNRTVAIKILFTSLLSSHQDRENFLQEAQFLEKLKHPHILPVHDFGINSEGIPYLIIEYATNGSLRDRIKSCSPNPLPFDEAVTILTQVGQALQYAHDQKIVHRDLKPENILFNAKNEAFLADFGIATLLDIGTQNADASGTPYYMAPEQFGGMISVKSDQYALGCIAYELLTGSKPFTAPNSNMLMYKHLRELPAPPAQFNSDLPLHIERAIFKAMAKDRADRHADVATFISMLSISTYDEPQRTKEQWLDEGNVQCGAKQYVQALVSYERAIQLDPNYVDAYIGKGNALHELKRYEGALTAYEQAIRLDISNDFAYIGKGNALCELKRYEEALVVHERAIQLNIDDVSAYIGKGNALCELKRYEEALVVHERAIQLDPNHANAYSGKGKALYGLKRYEEALVAYDRAIQVDPNYANAYDGKGSVLYILNRHLEALKEFEQTVQLDPNSVSAWYNSGQALERLGRSMEAKQAYEKSQQLDPHISGNRIMATQQQEQQTNKPQGKSQRRTFSSRILWTLAVFSVISLLINVLLTISLLTQVSQQPPQLGLSTNSLDFGLQSSGTTAAQQIVLKNNGGQQLTWNADTGGTNWLSLDSTSGTIDPNGSATIIVTADTSQFSAGAGSQSATITISSNGGNATVSVTLNVP